MEDFVTWVDTSKLKRTIMRYNDEVSNHRTTAGAFSFVLIRFAARRLRLAVIWTVALADRPGDPLPYPISTCYTSYTTLATILGATAFLLSCQHILAARPH